MPCCISILMFPNVAGVIPHRPLMGVEDRGPEAPKQLISFSANGDRIHDNGLEREVYLNW